jgi:hypothetical protein
MMSSVRKLASPANAGARLTCTTRTVADGKSPAFHGDVRAIQATMHGAEILSPHFPANRPGGRSSSP